MPLFIFFYENGTVEIVKRNGGEKKEVKKTTV